MKTIGINSKWNYDGVVALQKLVDNSLAELEDLLNDIGDCAYQKGYNDGCENQESRCNGCAFENVEEWEMPCAKCKRACKDYWRKKA